MKNFCKNLASEFQCKNFCFQHSEVEDFYRSQWQRSERSAIYLIYRWLIFLFFAVFFLVQIVFVFNGGKILIYLTNWGILLCLVTNLCGVILVTRWHFDIGATRTTPLPVTIESNSSMEKLQRTPFLVKFYWFLHAVTLPLALMITTVYWAFLYGKMNKPMRFPTISFVAHTFNAVFMIMDFWIVRFPVRLLHSLYAMMLPIIFFIFTLFYYLANGHDEFGNPYIYPIVYWKYPQRGLITFAGVFLLYVFYGILIFAFYKLKRYLHKQITSWRP